MRRAAALAFRTSLLAAPLIGGFPCPGGAAGPEAGPDRTIEATIRSIDAARGVVTVERDGGGVANFAVDGTDTLIFLGIRALGFKELSEGMRVEIDYRDATGGAPPRATWIEVREGTPER